MTSEIRDRAKELFAEAIDLAADDLAGFVARVERVESAEVADAFRQLMEDYRAAEDAGFLASPASRGNSGNNATLLQSITNPSDTVEFISGESLSAPRGTSERPGPLLADDYQILDEIGRGGMGTVYRAYQLSLRRHVAVKIIPTHLIRSPEEAARFYIEAEAAAKLEHPGIVQVQDVGERNGVHYYTMALVTGGSLADFVGKEKRLTRQRAAEVIESVSRAVQYAHDRAVIHRDIKPANILLDGDGKPRLTDFGLAKLVNDDDHLTMTGQVMGTPSYMAPEQAEGDSKAVSNRTDVYSLGATLYALLAGKAPFSGETLFSTLQQVQKSAPAPLPASVPLDLRTICNKCLEKNPADRYASAADLADDLRRYLDGFPISARRVGVARRAIAWSRRNPQEATLVGAIALVLIAASVVSTLLYVDSQHNLARANANARQLESAIEDTLIYASEDLLVDAPGMEQTRRTLLENARNYFEQQLATGDIPGEKVADVTFRLGKIAAALGDNDAAASSYDRSIELYEHLVAKTPVDTNAPRHWHLVQQLAQVHREYADLGQLELMRGKENELAQLEEYGLDLFVKHSQRCANLRRQAADSLPDDYEVQRKYANAQMNLGLAKLEEHAAGADAEALETAELLIAEGQQIRDTIQDKHPEPIQVMIDKALGLEALAGVQLRKLAGLQGDTAQTILEQVCEKRVACVKLLSEIPAEMQTRRTNELLAIGFQNCGDTFERLGNQEQAITYYNGMQFVRSRMLLRNPGVTADRVAVASAQFDISQKLLVSNQTAASFELFRRCQKTLIDGAYIRPDDPKPIDLLVDWTIDTAEHLVGAKLPDEAMERLEYAIQQLQELPASTRESPHIKQALKQLGAAKDALQNSTTDRTV